MKKLNFPDFEFQFQSNNGKTTIFDILRKKFVVLTPEEWVRQNFIHLLIYNYKYPKSLIKLESSLKYNQLNKRSDIKILGRDLNYFMLIECKAPEITLDDKVLKQIAVYNQTIKARYIVVTNGMKHYCWFFDSDTGQYQVLSDLPPFPDFIQ